MDCWQTAQQDARCNLRFTAASILGAGKGQSARWQTADRRTGDSEIDFRKGYEFISFPQRADWLWAHSASYPVLIPFLDCQATRGELHNSLSSGVLRCIFRHSPVGTSIYGVLRKQAQGKLYLDDEQTRLPGNWLYRNPPLLHIYNWFYLFLFPFCLTPIHPSASLPLPFLSLKMRFTFLRSLLCTFLARLILKTKRASASSIVLPVLQST